MKKLVLETTAPFQGLPELVADRGRACSRRKALQIEWVERESADKSTDVNVNSPKGLNPFSSHGKMLEQGKADMYNACEWGNYCRVQDTKVGSRQVGRRGIVTYAAIVVRPDSPVYTAQQLAGRTRRRAVLLRHALSRAASARRLHAARADQAVPHLERLAAALRRHDARRDRGHHADRALRHAGGEEGLPADLRGVLSRHRSGVGPRRRRDLCRVQPRGARGGEAHQRRQGERISATSSTITRRRTPRSARSRPQDLRASRIVVCDPAPIPLDEMQRTYDWLKSWGMLEQTATPLQLVNLEVQQRAHTVAAE